MRPVVQFGIVSVLLCLAASSAWCQESDQLPLFIGEDIVVTATRTPRSVQEVPASVAVITRQEIDESGAKKIDDVLRLIPGLEVRRSLGVVTMSPTVSIRGMGDQPGRTLVMIDGIPANKADTGNFLWNRINLQDVERIEVVRGPASALYGSHAMGGVINIITTRPSEKRQTSFLVETGNLDTQQITFATRGMAGRGGYLISGSRLDTDGYDPVPANSDDRTEYTVSRDAKENMLRLRISPDVSKNERLLLDVWHFDDERGEGERIRDPQGVYRSFDTQQLSLLYDRRESDTDWSLKIYDIGEDYFWNRERLRSGSYTRYEVNVDRTERGALLQASRRLSEQDRVTVGLDYKLGKVDGADNYKEGTNAGLSVINQGKQRIVGLFAQYESPLARERGQMVIGGRYDWADIHDGRFVDETGSLPDGPLPGGRWPDSDWSAFSPKAGLLYHASPRTDLRLNIGRAFRPAILDDLFRSGILQGRYYRAKPDLQPETVWTYEAGVEHRPNGATTMRLTGYWSDAGDFFYAILVDPDFEPKPLYERRNVAEVRIRGLEGEMEHCFSPTLFGFLNITWNKSTIERFERLSSTDPDLTGNELEFSPRWKANLGLRYRGEDGWKGSVAGRFVDEQFANPDNTAKIDRYFVVDLSAGRQLPRGWEVALEVRNLLDKRLLEGDYLELVDGGWTNLTDPTDPSSPLLGDVTLDAGRLVSLVAKRTF